MSPLLLAALVGLVLQDETPLRAAPQESSPRQAVLSQGESLEVRGERPGYLQVYDHRLERGGYVKRASIRTYSDDPAEAPALFALLRFMKDAPGLEALGIGHVALFLKSAPATAINADVFDALGALADRLARQASVRVAKPGESVAGRLDVAASYGVKFQSFDVGGRSQVCYDGEAFGRVLALNATDDQKARAALGLTRLECIDPAMSPADRRRLDEWRATILDRPDTTALLPEVRDRLHVRRAGVWAALAYERMREGDTAASQAAAERALKELALVDRQALAEEDRGAFDAAGTRVGASRWAAASVTPTPPGLHIETAPGEPGQTCVRLLNAKELLVQRCTFGLVWSASARAAKSGTSLALAVQPTDAWRELWVFHATPDGWTVDVLAPSATEPDVGYIEYAGWSPDGSRLLTVREARMQGGYRKSFEVLNVATLAIETHADQPGSIRAFARWQAPDWKAETVAIR